MVNHLGFRVCRLRILGLKGEGSEYFYLGHGLVPNAWLEEHKYRVPELLLATIGCLVPYKVRLRIVEGLGVKQRFKGVVPLI